MNAASPQALCDDDFAMLSRLAEIGMKIAAAIEIHADRVVAEGEAAPAEAQEQAARAFALPKIARSIRLTLMLRRKLATPVVSKQAAAWARADKVERIVRRVAEGDGREPAEVEHLSFEAGDRLESDDLYGDITARPISEILALVCKDLGLVPDWPLLAEEAWAQEELESGEVGWPLADVMALPPKTDSPAPYCSSA